MKSLSNSAFGKAVEFHVVQELDVPANYQTVGDGVAYLEQSYDDSFGDCDQTAPRVAGYPRASY